MPPKRAAKESQAETQAVNKRYRQAIDDVAEEYVCPITAELPVDPVNAEDGRCYERHAIEEWFSRGNRTSPTTNEQLAHTFLTPNHHAKSLVAEFLSSSSGTVVD